MRAWKYQTVGLLCLIVVILIVLATFYKQRIDIHTVQIETPSSLVNGIPSAIEQNQPDDVRKNAITSGLPEEYQIPNDAELARMDESTLMQIYWKRPLLDANPSRRQKCMDRFCQVDDKVNVQFSCKRYINMLQILCKDVIRVGSFKDGGKEICIDIGFKPKAPCLVYSFGINYQWDFDKAIVESFGCDVHCFDPSMKNDTKRLSEHVWFYQWGLGGENYKNGKGWEIKTLDTIRRELGHTNRTIDILKIDIEGDEWNSIPQMISSGALSDVRQLSMETHFGTPFAHQKNYWGNLEPHKQLSALRQLYDYGYRTFMRERNLWGVQLWPGINGFITNVNEVSMIKPV